MNSAVEFHSLTVYYTLCLCLRSVLFPSRAFEGIMSEQKIKKVHQNSKDKELGTLDWARDI